MANTTITAQNLRGFALSATELRAMVDWPEALVEDYLNIIDNLFTIADAVNQKNDIIKTVTNVAFADSPYTITADDEEIFFDTSGGDIVANLPAGSEGRNFRLLNVSSSGNKVTLNPDGTELLFGDTVEYIYDAEALIITYDTDFGWY